MRFFQVVSVAALAGAAVADGVHHVHVNNLKRDVVYVTDYSTTTVYVKRTTSSSQPAPTFSSEEDLETSSIPSSSVPSSSVPPSSVPPSSAPTSLESPSASGEIAVANRKLDRFEHITSRFKLLPDDWKISPSPSIIRTKLPEAPVASAPSSSPEQGHDSWIGAPIGTPTDAYHAPSIPTSIPPAPATESVPPTSSTSESSSPAPTDADQPIGTGSEGVMGITYSPYNDDGTCKNAGRVASEIKQLSGYPIIRLYGVDCSQVENVLKAKAPGQKLFLGIFFMDQIEQGIQQLANAVEKFGSWNDIYTISIGNELVNNGEATVSQIAGYMKSARAALAKTPYNGPIVSIDTFIAVINNPGLCDLSDYMAVNAHPYFDQYTKAQDSGKWLVEQMQRVSSTCGGKRVVITETGWPHRGNTFGVAVASRLEQDIAIKSIKKTCGDSVFLFNAFDDGWKPDGAQGVEKYWGLF